MSILNGSEPFPLRGDITVRASEQSVDTLFVVNFFVNGPILHSRSRRLSNVFWSNFIPLSTQQAKTHKNDNYWNILFLVSKQVFTFYFIFWIEYNLNWNVFRSQNRDGAREWRPRFDPTSHHAEEEWHSAKEQSEPRSGVKRSSIKYATRRMWSRSSALSD